MYNNSQAYVSFSIVFMQPVSIPIYLAIPSDMLHTPLNLRQLSLI